jgi:hypothetical protein
MPMRAWLLLSLLLSACNSVPATPAVTPAPSASPSATPSPSTSAQPTATPAPAASASPTPAPGPTPDVQAPGPQVIAMTPTANGTLGRLEFKLVFGEPMDRPSVEQAFSVHLLKDRRLSWQSPLQPLFATLRGGIVPNPDDLSTLPVLLRGTDFEWSWNEAGTECSLRPKRSSSQVRNIDLPTDVDLQQAPVYAISFAANGTHQTIRTQKGETRSQGWFRTHASQPDYAPFQVVIGNQPPELERLGIHQEFVAVTFSTPMAQSTPWGMVSSANSHLNTGTQSNVLNPANYYVRLFKWEGVNTHRLVAAFPWSAIDRDTNLAQIAPVRGQIGFARPLSNGYVAPPSVNLSYGPGGFDPWESIHTVQLILPKEREQLRLSDFSKIEVELLESLQDASGAHVPRGTIVAETLPLAVSD